MDQQMYQMLFELQAEVNQLRQENEMLKNIMIASSPIFSEEQRTQAMSAVQAEMAKQELHSAFK